MGLTTMVRILWTSIVGGKKLKGGVAMEHPERMNLIDCRAGRLSRSSTGVIPWRVAEAFKYVEQGTRRKMCILRASRNATIVATIIV